MATKYIEYRWGYVDPKYDRYSDMSTCVSLDELEEEFGKDILNSDAKEAILRYLTETKYGLFLTHTTDRSELWVEIVEDYRNKKVEKKEDGRWDEWMDSVFPSFRNDD